MSNEFFPFVLKKPDKKLYKKICRLVNEQLNYKCIDIIAIHDNRHDKLKTYKLTIKKHPPIRLDIKFDKEVADLQLIANQYDIEIPKVIAIFGKYKFSEWIDGVMISNVVDIPDVFIKSGEMMARLNLIEHDNKFLTNSEFSLTNAIWTPDEKIYLIDHGRMKLVPNTDMTIVQVLLKRMQTKQRISLFLKGYSKHKDISSIEKLMKINKNKWRKYAK